MNRSRLLHPRASSLSKISVCLAFLVLVSGCGKSYRVNSILVLPDSDGKDSAKSVKPLNLQTFKFCQCDSERGQGKSEECDECKEETTAYKMASGTDAAAKIARNRLAYVLITRSDAMYHFHQSDALATSSNLRGIMDLAATGLGGIGALLTGGQTPNILSGSASFVNSTSEIVTERVYQRFLVPAIFRSTAESRAAKLALIQQRLHEDVSEYSVDEMIRDVLEYHYRGSFYYGIMTLTKATADETDSTPPPRVTRIEYETGKPPSAGSLAARDLEQLFKVWGFDLADADASIPADYSDKFEILKVTHFSGNQMSVRIKILKGTEAGDYPLEIVNGAGTATVKFKIAD